MKNMNSFIGMGTASTMQVIELFNQDLKLHCDAAFCCLVLNVIQLAWLEDDQQPGCHHDRGHSSFVWDGSLST